MRTTLVAAAGILACSLVPLSAGAKCARTEQRPVILTTRDTALPDDGGVLVGWAAEVYTPNADHPTGDPTDQPTWTAAAGKTKVALTRTSLAPGLSVYRLAKTAAASVVLADKAGKPLGTFTHAAKNPNTMPAPAVVSLRVSVEDQKERWVTRHAVAKLRSAPPEAAIALVTYRVDKAGTTPLGFVRIADTHDKLTTIETFEDDGHCGQIATGSRPAAAGEQIVFAWVDAFGRLSPLGPPVTAK